MPEKFKGDLKVSRQLIEQVNVHHPHLEGMLLMSILADIANRAMLFIGVPDTGKSRVCKVIEDSSPRMKINPHGVTVNGLKFYAERMTGASLTVLVEDLSRSGNEYMQINTVSVLAGLSYSGFVEKHNQSINLSIHHVKMSALIYAQPLILKRLVGVDEFDSDIRDKCPRFYHLYRPEDPFPKPLDVTVKYLTLDRKKVEGDGTDEQVIENLRHEVSKGRAIEHCIMLVEACARLNERDIVTEADKWMVKGLTNNFQLESFLFTKKDLEGPRKLDINAIPVFTAFLSFPLITVKSLGLEFGVSERRTRQILSEMAEWVIINDNHVYPTKEAKRVMDLIRFEGEVP